ncbi:MAG: tetratricopeptide repeat protein, partial [Bradymonadaceae bacterium]
MVRLPRSPTSLDGAVGAALIAFSLLLATRALGAPGPAVSEPAATRYRNARAALDEHPARAFRLADALPTFSVADDRRLDLLADTAVADARLDRAIRALAHYRDAVDEVSEAYRAGLVLAEIRLLRGELQRADDLLTSMSEEESSLDVETDDRRYLVARRHRLRHDLARARSDLKRARRAARRLKVEYPGTQAAQRRGLVEIGELSADERFTRAEHLYQAWDYRRARRVFRTLTDHPRHGGPARWYLGHIALNHLEERPERAAEHFRPLTQDESSPYASRALYQLARTYMNREDYDRARTLLDTYHRRYPQGRHTEDVFYYRGWLPYDHDRNRAAIEGFRGYIDRYGRDGPRSSYIYGFLAWTHMRLEQWKKAIAIYDRMEPFGNTLVWGKALYWQAYAHRRLGQPDAAIAHLDELRATYPLTYYGILGEQLRARIQGTDPRASQVWWPEGSGDADDSARIEVWSFRPDGTSDRVRSAWWRARSLVRLGERERARDVLEPVRDRLLSSVDDSRRDAWVHALGKYVGDYHRMWVRSTGGSISALPDLPDPKALRSVMAYPRAYPEVVRSVADEFDLSPHMIWSIMRQESRYRPGQISHADAVGALQMIP